MPHFPPATSAGLFQRYCTPCHQTPSGTPPNFLHGDEATATDLEAMFGFYLQTFHDYGNSPALTLAFLRHLATAMPRNLVMFLADHDGRTVAGALCLRGGDTLYGRYWGAIATLPGLHFETCYYQGIDYCLREGLQHGQRRVGLHGVAHQVRSAGQGTKGGSVKTIETRGASVPLSPRSAEIIGMALHELATNAAKYGPFREPVGRLDVRWQMQGSSLSLEWRETVSRSEIRAPKQEGFGSKLARTSATHQLGGSIDFEWLPGGVNIALTAATDRLSK